MSSVFLCEGMVANRVDLRRSNFGSWVEEDRVVDLRLRDGFSSTADADIVVDLLRTVSLC